MTLAERTRHLTNLQPARWPYAPVRHRIRVVPASTYQGDWAGRWSWKTHTAYINADLPPGPQQGVVAHELAHARWSTPLPSLRGEEGSTELVLELFDELRVERFAIAASVHAYTDIRYWLRHDTAATIDIPNRRAAALAYGFLYGHHHTGAVTATEAGPVHSQFVAMMGDVWCDTLDGFLEEALNVRPGDSLVGLARTWDHYATTL